MSTSRKKVVLRTTTDRTHAGFLPLAGIVYGDNVDLLGLDGRIVSFALAQVRWICFVRDFNLNDTINPERLTRRTFLARPRSEGAWVRLTLTDGETLEGLAPTDISLLDGLLEDRGLFLTPPDIRSNTQRVFVPRSSIAELHLVGVVTTPSRAKPVSTAPHSLIGDLFSSPDELQSRS